jgi:hypothetical protein
MTGSNLPPGTTPADIDEAFGDPGRKIASGAVDVAVDVEVPGYMDDDEIREELADAVRERLDIDGETVIEIAGVRIGEVYEK